MTQNPWIPAAGVPAGVPADETGVYPALAGYTPMETSRRVVVVLADMAIFMGFYILALLFSLSDNLAFLAVLLYLAVLGLNLWALFARSARLGGVPLQATYVDVTTGRPNGGKVFLKFLVQGLAASLSFGIVPLVVWFATVKEPLKRNWFDRMAGLMLVDERTGRKVREVPAGDAPTGTVMSPGPLAPAPYPSPVPTVAPVVPVTPVAPVAPIVPAAPTVTPVVPGGPAVPVPPSARGEAGPSFAAPPSFAPPAPPAGGTVGHVGLITSVPGMTPEPTPRASEEALLAAPDRPVVVERAPERIGALPEEDRTELAPDLALAAGPGAWLDGIRLGLTPAIVLGRAPQPPGSHPDAVPHAVDDQQVSKTHLLLGEDEQGVYVIDLHSTNGVGVASAAGAPVGRIEAGRRIHVPAGGVVRFGQRTVEIRA